MGAKSVLLYCRVAARAVIATALTSSSLVQVTATSPRIGIKACDWAEYTFPGASSAQDNRAQLLAERIDILDAQASSVTFRLMSTWSTGGRGTTWNVTDIGTVNLNDGTDKMPFIISAELNQGDIFHDPILGNITVSAAEDADGRATPSPPCFPLLRKA